MSDFKIIESSSHNKYNFYFKYDDSQKVNKNIKNKITISFLIFLILLTVSINFFTPTNENIYKKYYTIYLTPINRSNEKDTLDIAFNEISNQKYDNALSILKSEKNKSVVSYFFMAVSLQELGKYKDAIANYNKVIQNNNNLLIEQSHWYSGLCYIKLKENDKALQCFNNIPENSNYKKPAQEIISKIK